MKTIRISEQVWNEIAKRGKFGETPDDVLRRVFKIDEEDSGIKRTPRSTRNRYAIHRMRADVRNGELFVSFEHGPSNKWVLPSKEDKFGIRAVRKRAIEFAENSGASSGQVDAVKKALTDAGYHLTK